MKTDSFTRYLYGRLNLNSLIKSFQVFWCVVMLATVGMLAYSMEKVTSRYLRWEIKITEDKLSMKRGLFPDVTICPSQRLGAETVAEVLGVFKKDLKHDFHSKNNILQQRIAELSEVFHKVTPEEGKHARELATGWHSNLDLEEMRRVGHKLWEMLIQCRVGRANCAALFNSSLYQHKHFGNCYTLHSAHDVTESGLQNGLSLTLYNGLPFTPLQLQVFRSVGYVSNPLVGNDGMRVILHPRGSDPLPLMQGYDVSSGKSVNLGVQVFTDSRMTEPYGKCLDEDPFRPYDVTEDVYQNSLCLERCRHSYIISLCNCTDFMAPKTRAANVTACHSGLEILHVCNQWFDESKACVAGKKNSKERLECINQAQHNLSNGNVDITASCNCFPACRGKNTLTKII